MIPWRGGGWRTCAKGGRKGEGRMRSNEHRGAGSMLGPAACALYRS